MRTGTRAVGAMLFSAAWAMAGPGAGQDREDSRPAAGACLDLGSRRELMVDDYLVEQMTGCALELQKPVPREIAMVFDRPWEGNACWAPTVFRDGPVYRMYYLARHYAVGEYVNKLAHPAFTAYLESKDGVTWERPNLGLVEFRGNRTNNIVYPPADSPFPDARLLVPFKDDNPDCAADARYKALAGRAQVGGQWSLVALKSADGLHWTLLSDQPVIREGVLDSQNIAFWDAERKGYRAYFRDYRPVGKTEIRDIRTATSKDFVNWSKGEWLQYPGASNEQIYAGQIKPYPRAPHLYIGFPLRYTDRMPAPNITFRQYALKDSILHLHNYGPRVGPGTANRRFATALTDALFMTSRDGCVFRRWPDAFLRPGPANWMYGDNLIAWHVVETPSGDPDTPPELSLYAVESYWIGHRKSDQLRRYTLRLDGFVALHASAAGGSMLTRPLLFSGRALELNYATSAAGSMTVEIQDAEGNMIPGYAAEDCHELFGDDVARIVAWNGGRDLGKLAGRPIRLLFAMKESDLYSLRFVPEIPKGDPKITYLSGYEKEGVTFTRTANRLVADVLERTEGPGRSATAVSEAIARRLASLPDAIAREDYRRGFRGTVANIARSVRAVPRLGAAAAIDGAIARGEWDQASRLDAFTLVGTNAAPRFATQAMLGRDDRNLYVAFTCREQDVGAPIDNSDTRDGEVWRGDCVEVFFQGADGKARQVVVDSNGTVWDGLAGEAAWNSRGTAATSADRAGNEWTVELSVPFADLGIEPKPGMLLRGNVCRSDITHRGAFWFKDAEHSSWCATLTSFGDPDTFGIFQLE